MTPLALLVFGAALGASGWAVVDAVADVRERFGL